MSLKLALGLILVAAGCTSSKPTESPVAMRAMGKSISTQESPSDETIGREIRRRIDLAGPALATGIIIEVNDGVVTLRGFAPTQADAWRAEGAAHSVPGVKQVRNQIIVNTPKALP